MTAKQVQELYNRKSLLEYKQAELVKKVNSKNPNSSNSAILLQRITGQIEGLQIAIGILKEEN